MELMWPYPVNRLVDLNTESIWPAGFDCRLSIVDIGFSRSGIAGGSDCRVAIWLAGFSVFAGALSD